MLTSELNAVNTMLSTLAFHPVNSMTATTLRAEVSVAKNILEEVQRDVLSDGWSFNSETKVTYSPDTDDRIAISDHVLHIDATRGYNTSVDVVQRGQYLYDRKNHTYAFDTDLTCDQVVFLTWTDLPEVCRRLCMIRASRIFADRMDGTQATHAYTTADEAKARRDMQLHHALNADTNYLQGSDITRRQSVMNRVK